MSQAVQDVRFARRVALAGIVLSALALCWAILQGAQHLLLYGPWVEARSAQGGWTLYPFPGKVGDDLPWMMRLFVQHAMALWSLVAASFAFALVASLRLRRDPVRGRGAFLVALFVAVAASVAIARYVLELGYGFPGDDDVLLGIGGIVVAATVATCAWIARRLGRAALGSEPGEA